VLVEAEVVESKVEYRGRRTLVVKLTDGERDLWVRFLNFYPSQVKQFKEGKRVRLFGEVRPGMFGDEMVHPRYRIVAEGAPLSKSLTPVYPTTAGLPQHQLRDLINGALDTLNLEDTLDAKLLAKLKLMPFRDAVMFLHRPPPDAVAIKLDDRTHPAWRRLKFDELLAQQLAMRIAYRERRAKNAPPLPAATRSPTRSRSRCRSRSRARSAARRRRSRRISRRRTRCAACCRATSAAARRWSPRSPRCRPSRTAGRRRSWRPRKSSPSSTTSSSRTGSSRSA
jgi:ATP-dependent DNA helicase RecG